MGLISEFQQKVALKSTKILLLKQKPHQNKKTDTCDFVNNSGDLCSYGYQAHSQNCEKRQLASPCPSVCPQRTRPSTNGFWWNLIFETSWKSVEKIQISLKSDKNNGYFIWWRFDIFDDISLNSSLHVSVAFCDHPQGVQCQRVKQKVSAANHSKICVYKML
jgi:hypothetical protein